MYSEKFLIDLTKLLIDCHKTAVTIFDENKRIYMINDFLYGYYCKVFIWILLPDEIAC